MGHGSNYITVQGVKAGQWFCYATEDKAGNRESFYSYTQIPEYTPPTPEDESTPKITDFRISSNKELEVVFNQTINGSYTNEFTQISGMDGKILFGASYSSEGGLEDNVLNLTIMNSTISPGSHTLTLYFKKEDNSYSLVTYNFTM